MLKPKPSGNTEFLMLALIFWFLHCIPQPFDFFMEAFHQLFFDRQAIPEDLKEDLTDITYLSKDPELCSPYIVALAESCKVRVLDLTILAML